MTWLRTMEKIYFTVGITGSIFFTSHTALFAQVADSVKTKNLPVVEIESTAISPLSLDPHTSGTTVKYEDIQTMNAANIADITKQFIGVTVKDYGGIGGLKTISVRGLGSQHNVVTYDGVAMSDSQTGQIDLGKLSCDHLEEVGLSNGRVQGIFQSARAFSSASVLQIETRRPQCSPSHPLALRVQGQTGSFGLRGYGGNVDYHFHPQWSMSVLGNYATAKGDYPYLLHYGWAANDSTSMERRKNADVHIGNIECNLWGDFPRTTVFLKAYGYYSERGLPGSTVFYYDYGNQRLEDRTVFLQSKIDHTLNAQWQYRNYNKLHYGNVIYTDPDIFNSLGFEQNHYIQREYYSSHSVLFAPTSQLNISVNTDGILQNMSADIGDFFPKPTRYTWLTAIAAEYEWNGFVVQSDVLQTAIYDHRQKGPQAGNAYRLSPHILVGYNYRDRFFLSVFYKDIFRMPTFNDLYYNRVGNVNLKPEKAQQYNLHAVWSSRPYHRLSFAFTFDGYLLHSSDKIVAIPTKNLFVWSMVNLGKVETLGLSVATEQLFRFTDQHKVKLRLHYDLQQSVDKTDRKSPTYNCQIPYIPRHSGTASVSFLSNKWQAGYNLLLSGIRYTSYENTRSTRLQPYADHSLSAEYQFKITITAPHVFGFAIKGEVLNLLDRSYEIVRFYPMPGRSFRLTLKIHY